MARPLALLVLCLACLFAVAPGALASARGDSEHNIFGERWLAILSTKAHCEGGVGVPVSDSIAEAVYMVEGTARPAGANVTRPFSSLQAWERDGKLCLEGSDKGEPFVILADVPSNQCADVSRQGITFSSGAQLLSIHIGPAIQPHPICPGPEHQYGVKVIIGASAGVTGALLSFVLMRKQDQGYEPIP